MSNSTPHPAKRGIDTKTIMDLFDVGPGMALTLLMVSGIILCSAVIYFVKSAPPTSLVITSGPEGSVFQKNAKAYAKVLESNGVKVTVLTSQGSIQNLERLQDPALHVDVGMVQAGISIPGKAQEATDHLISLGSISHQPLLIFYRGKKINYLSEFKGKKLAIGPEGSGTHQLSMTLLKANGIVEGDGTTLSHLDPQVAADELQKHTLDAAFIMSESASTDILKALLHANNIELYSFKQVAAYTRKVDYLESLNFPEGAIDLGKDIPSHDIALVGPMVELIAVKSLHPALSDLLLEAATQIHGRPGLFQQRGEFPAPIEHTIHISEDAARYYKSGKSFLYRYLPFWLASLLSRIVVVVIPALVVLIPALRSVPAFFRWRVQIKIYQHYRELLQLEHSYLSEQDPETRTKLRGNFDRIEDAVNRMKVKSKYADQVYGLRGHIDYVRRLVQERHAS